MAFGAKMGGSPSPALDRKDQVGCKTGTAEANLVVALEVLDFHARCGTLMLRSLLNIPHFLSQFRWLILSIFSLLHMSCSSILAYGIHMWNEGHICCRSKGKPRLGGISLIPAFPVAEPAVA